MNEHRSLPPSHRVLAALITLTSVFWSSGVPLWTGWLVYPEQVLIVALALAMALAFLSSTRGGRRLVALEAAASLVFGAWLVLRFPALTGNAFYHPVEALAGSFIGCVLIIDAVRRTLGWALLCILVLVCLYALFSSSLVGPLQSRSLSPERLLTFLVLDSASLAGAALSIAVVVVVPFLILARLLLATGGAAFFSDLALALAGRRRGGAGKIAIVASAFFGSVSGSAVSNVASTGAITIPMMKSSGYGSRTAGAIEAAASTGGQLMPPIMGAAAFLVAENLQASYIDVMLAALIPSGLYYFSLFVFADLEAGRLRISPLAADEVPSLRAVLAKGWFIFMPFAALLLGLFALDLRPETAALLAILVLALLSLHRRYDGEPFTLDTALEVVVSAGRTAIDIILICAIAGMIIGLVGRSGLSFGLGLFLVQLGQASLPLLLVLTAGVCIVMGMGLPTVGVYLLLASLAAPPLVELGLQPMAAHLFVLYFGMLSMLTPPVAIAAFVAANLARAPTMGTALEAVRLAWPAYLVPFLFAVSPALLFDGPPMVIAATALRVLAGVYLITAALVGFSAGSLMPVERTLLAVCGLGLLLPRELFAWSFWVNGVAVLIAFLWWANRIRRSA